MYTKLKFMQKSKIKENKEKVINEKKQKEV